MEEKKEVNKEDWNNWVVNVKDKIKKNSNFIIINKYLYIFFIFTLSLLMLLIFLIGLYFISNTGNFKSIINNTNFCSCPAFPTIPACPQINCPNCNCPAAINNCSINVPSNLNVIIRNSS